MHEVGPLAPNIVNTFRGGSYTQKLITSDTILYRSYGGAAEKIGSYWSKIAPAGPLQTQIDNALLPEWGNTMQKVTQIRIPAGATVYEGAVGEQILSGGGTLQGGGSQIYIPKIDELWLRQ